MKSLDGLRDAPGSCAAFSQLHNIGIRRGARQHSQTLEGRGSASIKKSSRLTVSRSDTGDSDSGYTWLLMAG